ncbi:hypothetical protein SynMINOS11_02482 [Synechococcus sp. Minos11]|jgi:hypothetical protein|nr:hypothetical protein SynMINOS11_02482 [Synechococcus sp. Minos11]|tara:strand:- start:7517 stop:7654 length:138 start_codon:yes stop_codon:yes gene_type:complete
MKAGERIRRRWPDPAAAAPDSMTADPLAPLLQHLHRSWHSATGDS